MTELAGYEFRLGQAETDEDKAAQRENIRAVKASLKAFGAEAAPPSKRAEKLEAPKEPKPKEVFPELKDKEWVKGEPAAVEELKDPEPAPKAAPKPAVKK